MIKACLRHQLGSIIIDIFHLDLDKLKAYWLTIAGLAIATVLLIVTLYFELDTFENLVVFLKQRDSSELDEFIIPSIIALVFFTINQYLIIRRRAANNEKVRMYKTMVHASNHVLRTCLNQMLLVKMSAEETPNFDSRVIALFDEIVASANSQLDALGKLEDINEKAIWEAIYANTTEIDLETYLSFNKSE